MMIDITPAQLEYIYFLEKHKIKEETKIYLTQNQAFERFGKSNVKRWHAQGKVHIYKRPRTVEYKMSELLKAAENRQDYL